MAEQSKKKQPLSLNERHNRVLLDLSASQPHHHRTNPPENFEGRRREPPNDDDDDVPVFSGFSDLDSPSPGGPMKSSPAFELLGDGNSSEKSASGFEDQPALPVPHFPEKRAVKVKLGGRRRLCKLSSKDDDDGIKKTEDEEPELAGLVDFDSPPSSRDAIGKDSSGGDEIRDILNDLTSKLDFLSIEKKRPVKATVPVLDSLTERKEEEHGYASATSSFAHSSDPSDSSSDSPPKGKSKIELDKEEIYIRRDLKVDGNARSFDGLQNPANSQKENRTKMISGKSGAVSKATAHNYVRLDEDDDDCVVLHGKKGHKGEGKYDLLQGIDDDDDKVDVAEHQNDEFVLEYEKAFISRGSNLTFVLPPKIAKILYPHQRDGMKWLWSLHCQGKGGILGDDMGLGKTMQICGFLAGLFNSRLIKRAMVVAPKTLLPHWIKELSVVGLSGKTREYFGTCAKARQYELQYIFQDKGVLLTTYDIVRNNAKALRGDDYFYGDSSEDEITWDYMILDEGHLIKNPSTQRAKSLLEIPSAHRIIISGTPIQNNLKELWALFNFCCPELLGDKNWFKERFESLILRGSDKNASDRAKRIGSAAAKELRERIQPHFLRRLKSEVFRDDNDTNTASLSKKNEIIVWLRLTSCQRQLYEAFLKSEIVLSAFDGSPLAALTILKKICDHPLLLTKRAAEDVLEGMDSMLNQEDSAVAEKLAMHIADVSERSHFGEKHANLSCKISFILSLLDNLISEGHRILIFSQTRKMLNLIQESLITEGYTFLRIDGTYKASDRLKIVNDFQEGAAPIFLLTSQVGGLGLTLTKADRVIVVDPAWNPSTDNQSVDRAYRIGQKKDVIVYRLMTSGTIEEKIYKKQIFKGGLFKTATEQKEQTRYFSQQDLRELFSLPKHGFDVSVTQQQLHQEHDDQHITDESLKLHIEFLETQGIAGVSHHSLLFSKTAPPPPEGQDDEAERVKQTTYVRNYASSSRNEPDVDGAKYAFNPKDVKLQRDRNSPSTNSGGKHSESEIKERINRLSVLLTNKSLVSKLPDKGDNIQNQIAQLSLELNMIQTAKRKDPEVIDLDDLSGDFRKVLNV